MDKVYIIFWTQGGNTGAMATAIGDGVKAAGKEPVFLSPSEAKESELTELNGFAMGCPAMGCEVLEETEMEPFVAEVESIIKGKKIVLFGSYGWGDGQWMRDWEDRMKSGKRKRKVKNVLDVLIREQHPVIANKALFNIEYFKEV